MSEGWAPGSSAGFAEELRSLRRGGGVLALDSPDRLGPLLGEILHRLGPVDEDWRSVLVDLLLTSVPIHRQRWLVAVAYGLVPEVAGRSLTDRLQVAGKQLDRDMRTVQRRVNEVSTVLADALTARLHDLRDRPAFYPAGWTLTRFTGRLSFAGPRPRLVEEREIVARQRGLEVIEISVSLLGVEPGPDDAIEVIAHEGCAVKEVERNSSRFWTVSLELPRPLAYGEPHALVVEHVVPHRDHLDPVYGFAAYRSCRRFEASVEFADPDDVTAVWSFTGLPQTMLEHYGPGQAPPVPVDGTRIAHYQVDRPVHGLCYGLGWRWRRPADSTGIGPEPSRAEGD